MLNMHNMYANMHNLSNVFMSNFQFDLNLLYHRQLMSIGNPYYCLPPPMLIPPPPSISSYPIIPPPVSSTGPLRANYIYIN